MLSDMVERVSQLAAAYVSGKHLCCSPSWRPRNSEGTLCRSTESGRPIDTHNFVPGHMIFQLLAEAKVFHFQRARLY